MNVFNSCLVKKNTGFRILNIFSDSKPFSLEFIAKKIAINLNKNVRIQFIKGKNFIEHNPLNLHISNNYSKKTLKWKPAYSIDRIIKKLINLYESKNGIR